MGIESSVTRAADGQRVPTDCGELNWKITGQSVEGAEMTFGTCVIQPGQRNPLHSHPNCEEHLYVISGSCEHWLGDDSITLRPGDMIRIPRDVPHWARALGDDPLFAIIVFSSADRRVTNHEAGTVK